MTRGETEKTITNMAELAGWRDVVVNIFSREGEGLQPFQLRVAGTHLGRREELSAGAKRPGEFVDKARRHFGLV